MSDCSPLSRRSVRATLVSFGLALVFVLPLLGGTSLYAAPSTTSLESGHEDALDLEMLLASFGKMSGFEARFEEEKTLSLLAVPLRSEGRLFYLPGTAQKSQRLLRRVESPSAQDILISENAIRIRESGREEVIDLGSRTEVRPLVESLLWIFSGNRKALEEAFITDLEIEAAASAESPIAGTPWRLLLTPRNESLGMLIDRLEISGTGLGADRIAVFESGGDRSVMRVFEANPNRHFSEAEESSLFGRGLAMPAADND